MYFCSTLHSHLFLIDLVGCAIVFGVFSECDAKKLYTDYVIWLFGKTLSRLLSADVAPFELLTDNAPISTAWKTNIFFRWKPLHLNFYFTWKLTFSIRQSIDYRSNRALQEPFNTHTHKWTNEQTTNHKTQWFRISMVKMMRIPNGKPNKEPTINDSKNMESSTNQIQMKQTSKMCAYINATVLCVVCVPCG